MVTPFSRYNTLETADLFAIEFSCDQSDALSSNVFYYTNEK